MSRQISVAPATPVFPWWLVLGLVGVDYFSTLAYLPAMALESAGPWAPWAAVLVAAITLLVALPVYGYVVGRSPHGTGATGLIEKTIPGWRGKLLVLLLMGFVAADFVITRSLSTADAAVHVLANPTLAGFVDQSVPTANQVKGWLGDRVGNWLTPYWNRQVGVTLALLLLATLFWLLLANGINRGVLRLTAWVTGLYLLLNATLLVGLLVGLMGRPELPAWWDQVQHLPHPRATTQEWRGLFWSLLAVLIFTFPQMALGLSGFELSMSVAQRVRGRDDDDPVEPAGRIRATRRLLWVAGLTMSLFLIPAVLVVTLLVPARAVQEGGPAAHRALAYLAHDGPLNNGLRASDLFPACGPLLGGIYDASTVAILCLAGVCVMVSLRDFVPTYLHRMGMELTWAKRFGVLMQMFNGIILLVTVVFKASVSAQEWAYSTSVQVLLAGACLAASADLWRQWRGWWFRPLMVVPAVLALLFFSGTAGLTVWQNGSGLAIALAFVVALLASSFLSRWLRSTEMRFGGFTFADSRTMERWHEICRVDFQVLVPHRPGLFPLWRKNEEIRKMHRLPADAHLVFIEVELGDPSDFLQKPLMRIEKDDGLEVIRLTRAVSVAHVLAAIGLEWRNVGRPPEIIFGWSLESPLTANLNFLLFGEGNIPWMVQQLLVKAEPDEARRPRIVIG